jgi:hypothetical protein
MKEVRVCTAKRSNESPSGAFKRRNGLAQQDGGTKSRQVPIWEKSNLTLEEAAAYSGIGMIQWPCSLRNTLSSSSRRKSSLFCCQPALY